MELRFSRSPFGLPNELDVFQDNAYSIITNTMAICHSVLRRYTHVILRSRRTYVECSYGTATLTQSWVTLNHEKGKCFPKKNDYLGHVMRPEKLELDDCTTEAIGDLGIPRSVAELRLFLRLSSVYRWFVTVKKSEPRTFDSRMQEAYDISATLQDNLKNAVVQALPRRKEPLTFNMDV